MVDEIVDQLAKFTGRDSGFAFESMIPWLCQLDRIPYASLRSLTRIIPTIEAKITELLPPKAVSDDDADYDDEHDDAMDTGTAPPTKVGPPSGPGEAAWILTDPGVSPVRRTSYTPI